MDELCRSRDEAAALADLVEVRLDAARDPDPAAALQGRTRPVIVTCRPAWEGGGYRGSEDDRIALLRRAWTLGADFVDLEAESSHAAWFLADTRGQRIVLSWHDFNGVPADLEPRARTMAASPADVIKIAVRAASLADALTVFDLGRELAGRRFVALAMGMPGIATRVLAARVGSAWTYAGEGWAPGQVPARTLTDQYRFRHIGPDTARYGVVGSPIAHSLSPAMHNAAFAASGADAVYLPLEAATAADAMRFADALGFAGLSVTAPFKVALMSSAAPDAIASRAGALNTLRRSAAGWEATNTDLEGFLAPLRGRLALADSRAAIIGTGGAARAVALALTDAGAHVTIYGRDASRARAVAERVGGAAAAASAPPSNWDLLVHATPVGTAPAVDDSPLPGGPFSGRLVYDLVYNPPRTRLLADAERAGCEGIGGLEMLVAQAEAQQRYWTGRSPRPGVMREAAVAALDHGALSGRGATAGPGARTHIAPPAFRELHR